MFKFKRRAGGYLLALIFPFILSCSVQKQENPKLLHSVQIWAHKQKYLIPDEDDLHMAISAGKKNNVDPLLILAVIGVESSFKSNAKSTAGAIGYMQVVPKWHLDKIRRINDLWNPAHNVQIGAEILGRYIIRAKSVERALQMYNGSVGSTEYSDKVLKAHQKLLREII